MAERRSVLHEPLLSQTTEEEKGSRSASQSRELTEVGDEARARDHEVNEDDLLVTDSPSHTAVEIRGVSSPKEEDDMEQETATRQGQKRPWKTTNGRGRWFGRKRSDTEGQKGRREPSTWNSSHGTPKERRRQKHTVVRLGPPSPGQESRFEPAQVNDLQLQYEKEGFRITSRTASADSTPGIIDGRFSSSFTEPLEGYVAVEAIGVDMSTTRALEMCTKYVLNPFHIFLKVIGWRPLRSLQRDTQPCFKKVFNIIYPAFIFLMLVFTCCSQTISCFSRTRAHSPPYDSTGDFYVLDCRDGLVSSLLSTDLLLLLAYLWALYNFRWGEPEHLSTLIQKVFLSCNSNVITLKRSQRRLVFVLLTFLVMGILWVLYSTSVSVLRVFALRLNNKNTIIGWFFKNDSNSSTMQDQLLINEIHYDIIHYLFLVLSMLGFLFFDMLYVAVVINYCTQCQLLHYYVSSIKDKVVNKAYLLGDAVKEIYNVREFLLVLNGMTAFVTSLTLFIFLQGVALSYLDWRRLEPNNYLQIAVGFLNVLQWAIVAVLPIIQATRLTAECRGLKKLGLEIAARPFYYSDTPQLVLDSFLNYTNATNYKVKLMFIPMYSELVVGFLFMFLLVFSLVLTTARFHFATWI